MTTGEPPKITYTSGYTLIAQKDITKRDSITFCNLLNEEYKEACTFTPEAISEGGVKYNFIDGGSAYKSVRLGLRYSYKWPWVNTSSVMTDWEHSEDILVKKKGTIYTYLKSLHRAPVFTIDELRLWEACFYKIGLKRQGRYPRKKDLSYPDPGEEYVHIDGRWRPHLL